jgi:hypothetical protein
VTEPARRRRRVRTDGGGGESAGFPPAPSPADLAAMTSPVHDGDAESPHDEREVERGLRGLVGGGASQVGVAAAMRARDAARPTDEDLASAEANLIIIRRGWTPPPAAASRQPPTG